jgi:uncharacterized Tic20 family protein
MDMPPPLTPEPLIIPPEPPTPVTSEADRSWCIGLHLSGFAFFVLPSLGNIIAPLIIWLIKRADSPIIDATGKDVLNFQISYSIYLTVSAILCWMCIGFVVLPIVFIAWLTLTIIAAVKTSNGEDYRYPWIIQFLK